jgi:hypothetical protein
VPKRVLSYCPWMIAESDLNPVGDPELTRDLIGERQIGMVVHGQFDEELVLGLVAISMTRENGKWVPGGMCVPDTPIVIPEKSGMDINLLSGPQRHGFDEHGTWR